VKNINIDQPNVVPKVNISRDIGVRINSVVQGKDVPVSAAGPAAPSSIEAPAPPRRNTAAVSPTVAVRLPAACSTVADIASIAPADVHGVDSIFDVKVVNLKLHYFVKWTGYDVGNNTWEPEDHIMDPTLIDAFKRNFPSAHRDAVAEIAKRKLEKTRKTNSLQGVLAPNHREVIVNRMGRPIVPPRARDD
jgi:hypothetical protein